MKEDNFHNICIIIPAFEPSQILIEQVRELSLLNYRKIIIVDDGSSSSKQIIFNQLQENFQVIVIHLPKNMGKGAAIKTGIKWVIEHEENVVGIITVDADGQHLPKDVKKISRALLEEPAKFILGVRKFDTDVPLRSRFGNVLTSWLFYLRFGMRIQDTQTGLRAIPLHLMKKLINIESNRYEYEMACLIEAVKTNQGIKQIIIDTVYIDHNVSSHFHPIMDSMRIYYVFLRFVIVAFTSFLIDLVVFVILNYLTNTIFSSLFVARLVSSSFNFYQNKFRVYRSHEWLLLKKQALEYILLAIVVFFLSYTLIKVCVHLGMSVIPAKILVDAFLFFCNFMLQKKVIFKA